MYPDLEGKVAIVTGAGRHGGLGAAIARKLAEDGVRIVLHDLGQTKGDMAPEHGVGAQSELEQIAADLRTLHPGIVTHTADMRVEAEVEGLVARAVAEFGRLDILINNAGVGYLFGPFVEQTQEKWDTVLDVNLRGAFFAMKHAIKQMLSQDEVPGWGRGRVVSIGSRGSKSGSALTSSYIASKHGLVGLTRSVAIEMGPSQINVNMVCPNHVTTGLGSWQNDYMARMRGQTLDEYLEAMRGRIPLGRVGTPEDTANACAFLCSGQARYITGEAMNVSGGEEMH
ncbi:SDR family oxidoreductase [Sphingomonas sp. HITSZ_GF]|uniref:SDR family NAD(P)-dependent oxidoreductase n=1 Tax=Sphingomonas sp. HITSZ_GF TaxID=3037247 RepID=UPI00240DE1D0|nr:SDR family oxidoreductase [Sphingomonas sp. HITSZ_GF]MDG2532145.1 SDR family oxidoreductase [Sphingomonas sp. HITSZ_GF]